MSNDPLTEDRIRELCGCDSCDMCDPKDPDFGADCDEHEGLQDFKKIDDERRDLIVRLATIEKERDREHAILLSVARQLFVPESRLDDIPAHVEGLGKERDEARASESESLADLEQAYAVVWDLARSDPAWGGECVFCGERIDRLKDGPEKHGPGCAWRKAKNFLSDVLLPHPQIPRSSQRIAMMESRGKHPCDNVIVNSDEPSPVPPVLTVADVAPAAAMLGLCANPDHARLEEVVRVLRSRLREFGE